MAERYANALYDLADDQKVLDQVAEDLRGLRALIDESEDLRRLIRSPAIGRDDQMRAIAAIGEEAGLEPLTRNFLGLVARNRRLFALSGMIEGYLGILAKRRGEVTAHVSSAQPLDERQTQALTDALRRVVGGKVELDARVDPSLLGGLVVKIGSRLYDSSLRSKLQRLELAMKGA